MQQKTRCDPVEGSGGSELRCKRCVHFKIECSFERSPPRKSAPLPPAKQNLPSVPWAPSPESHPNDYQQHESTSGTSPRSIVTPSSGFGVSPRGNGKDSSAATTSSSRLLSSPTDGARVDRATEEGYPATSKPVLPFSGCSDNSTERFYEPPRYPIAPPSPPRTLDRGNSTPFEMLTKTPTWANPSTKLTNNGDVRRLCSLAVPRPRFSNLLYFYSVKHWGGPVSFIRDLVSTTTPRTQSKSAGSDDLVMQGVVSSDEAEALTHM